MISLYYGAKLQHWMVHDLAVQQEAADWSHDSWRNRIEGLHDLASPDNMDANPFRRYCRDHHLSRKMHSFKIWAYKSLSITIYPLKYIAFTIESTIRLVASLVLAATHVVGNECVRRNIASIKAEVLPPSKNFKGILAGIVLTAIFGGAALVRIYQNSLTLGNLASNYQREMDEITGDYVPLWKAYAEVNKEQSIP